jgi:hypothetical protein
MFTFANNDYKPFTITLSRLRSDFELDSRNKSKIPEKEGFVPLANTGKDTGL